MKCSEEVARKRILERNTSEIYGSAEYFHQLHLAHEEFFSKAISHGEIVICIDANQSKEEITELVQLMASEIDALARSPLLLGFFYHIKSVSIHDCITMEKLQAHTTYWPNKQTAVHVED